MARDLDTDSKSVELQSSTHRSVLSKRLPASGNFALEASALIQAAVGLEFALSGLNKLVDPRYVFNFTGFV